MRRRFVRVEASTPTAAGSARYTISVVWPGRLRFQAVHVQAPTVCVPWSGETVKEPGLRRWPEARARSATTSIVAAEITGPVGGSTG